MADIEFESGVTSYVRDDRAQDGTERFTVDTMVRPLDNDEEIAREIAGVFIESSRDLLAELSHAATDGNGDMVRSRAHSIKGSAGNSRGDGRAASRG